MQDSARALLSMGKQVREQGVHPARRLVHDEGDDGRGAWVLCAAGGGPLGARKYGHSRQRKPQRAGTHPLAKVSRRIVDEESVVLARSLESVAGSVPAAVPRIWRDSDEAAPLAREAIPAALKGRRAQARSRLGSERRGALVVGGAVSRALLCHPAVARAAALEPRLHLTSPRSGYGYCNTTRSSPRRKPGTCPNMKSINKVTSVDLRRYPSLLFGQ